MEDASSSKKAAKQVRRNQRRLAKKAASSSHGGGGGGDGGLKSDTGASSPAGPSSDGHSKGGAEEPSSHEAAHIDAKDGAPEPNPNATRKRDKKRRRPAKKSHDVNGKSTESQSRPPSGDSNSGKKVTSDAKVRSGDYPYPVDYNDHFETPSRAYDDIFPLLEYVLSKERGGDDKKKSAAKKKKKKQQNDEHGNDNAEATIYDPYFCTGRAATHLTDLFERHESDGIPSSIRIQHEKRDFYADVRKKCVPPHDVLVTNPPYSGNHKERCLEFCVKQLRDHGRPFFLLMPNYIATKDYFRRIVAEQGPGAVRTFYVAPSSQHSYEYEHPEGTGHEVSPFASVWFCGLGMKGGKGDFDDKSVTDAFVRFHSRSQSASVRPRIATSLKELIKVGGVSGEKRKNPRQRRKMRKQAMERAGNAAAIGGGAAGTGVGKDGQNAVGKRNPDGHYDMKNGKKHRIN